LALIWKRLLISKAYITAMIMPENLEKFKVTASDALIYAHCLELAQSTKGGSRTSENYVY